MLSVVGSIPEKNVDPVLAFIREMRARLGEDSSVDYNDMLKFLLFAKLSKDAGE